MTRSRREFESTAAGRRGAACCGAALLALSVLPAALVGAGLVASPTAGHAQEKMPAPEAAGQRAVVRWKQVLQEGSVTRIRLETTAPPRYRITKTDQPPVVEMELSDVELEGLPARVTVADGTVETVETRALPGGGGKLTVTMAGPGDADVVPWAGGLDLLVHLSSGGAPAGGAKPQGQIVRLLKGPERLSFGLGAAPTNLSGFVLSDGKRLVVDAEGVEIPTAQAVEEIAEGPVARVRMAKQDGRVRAVVEARDVGVFDGHRLEKTPEGFTVFLAAAGAPALAQAQPQMQPQAAAKGGTPESKPAPAAAAAAAAREAPSAPEPPPQGGGTVIDLGFRQEEMKSLVELVLSKPAPHVVREASPQRIVVDVLRTTLPDKFRRALDTSSFPGPVRLVAAYSRAGKGKTTDTRLVVDLRSPAPYRIDRQGPRISLVVEGGIPEPPVQGVSDVRREEKEVVVVEGKPGAAPAKAEADAKAPKAGISAPPGYTGRRLSMDFMDADIRNVLRLIGEVSGLNMVTGDDVQGKVTTRLVDVPWDQALDVILKTKGLDQIREGNVIRIAPADKLAAEKARAKEAEAKVEEKAPLVSDIISVNYASASELLDKVKAVLTQRGTVAIDQRTNSILIKDVAEKIKEAQALVTRLDTPTPQVLIEARIVEVASTYTKDLGVQWGFRYNGDSAHGSATNWAFPSSIGAAGATGTGNFAVNFPAAIAAGGPGSALALSLGSIDDVFSLDLRISALESSGNGRVVSSPRVATLDNRTAEISQGLEIPFTTATEDKIETQSIDYLLKLNVTPHVTADKSIIMKINLTKDNPSNTFFAVDSRTPAKETRAATTEVVVKDGETTVIGGIITDDKADGRNGVPFLSSLPWIGGMFRNKVNKDTKTELVIFITPKILNPTPVAGGL